MGNMFYTGVGSRRTPETIQYLMANAAVCLGSSGFILRSGGADGADAAFEHGVRHGQLSAEIYRPINSRRELGWITQYPQDLWDKAMSMAASSHPAWDRCSPYARALHARNAFQVMGQDLQSPSDFMLCWTPDGATTRQDTSVATGGTGTAIRIACMNQVRVFNLQRHDHYERVLEWVRSQGVEQPLEWNHE